MHTSSKNISAKKTSSTALLPPIINKNRYLPLQTHNDTNIDLDPKEVRQKIPPLYVYDITNFIEFRNTITPMLVHDFNIVHKNQFLKLNLTSADDFRTITKYFLGLNIKYHTYQFPKGKEPISYY